MGDFLTSQGLTYKGCIGMEMGKRPEWWKGTKKIKNNTPKKL